MAEGLDIEDAVALIAYLRRAGRIGTDEHPEVQVLAGGVSNKTVLVERPSGEAWVLKQALPKLRVKVDWFSDPARIRREAEALRWLPKVAPPECFTPLIFEDPPHHLLAMEAVSQPHENFKSMLLAGRVEEAHVAQFGRLLGQVHARSAGDRDAAGAFGDRSFFESLRLEPYYGYAGRQVPAAAAFLAELARQTRERRLTIVHGDYSPKNVLVHDGRIVLLDHEVIHWGDPAFDVGFALTHLLSKAHHLPAHRQRFADAARLFLAVYNEAVRAVVDGEDGGRGRSDAWAYGMTPMTVRHTLGCLLARVAGRSPLEYLTETERERQREVAVGLIARPPRHEIELVQEFLERV